MTTTDDRRKAWTEARKNHPPTLDPLQALEERLTALVDRRLAELVDELSRRIDLEVGSLRSTVLRLDRANVEINQQIVKCLEAIEDKIEELPTPEKKPDDPGT